MNCLVTGCDGFLGANLCKRLLANGHDVIGAALNRQGKTSLDALGVSVRLEYGDVMDAIYVDRLVNAYEAEWVFHLAAVSIVRIADQNAGRAFRTNILGTLNVVEACQRHKHVKKVVVASSDKAYGQHEGIYREQAPLMPIGAYEISKACADMIARQYGAVVARCANLFGPGDLNWSRLVPGSCRRVLRGEAPVIHKGARDYRREFLDVGSATAAYALLAERGVPGEAYNVGSGEVATAGGVATFISEIARAVLPNESKDSRCYEIRSQELNSEKIAALGWRPQTGLRFGLWNTFHWYQEYLRQ